MQTDYKLRRLETRRFSRRGLLQVGLGAAVSAATAGGAEPLVRSLKQNGMLAHWVGDRILILPNGGRVLGLFPTPGRNVVWVNPILADPRLLKAALSRPDWLNPGGDRTWISPEVEVFIGDPARMQETYKFPPEIDPASYQVIESDAEKLTLATRLDLNFMRSKRRVRLQLRKTVRVLHQPPFPVPGSAPCVGYELATSIEAPDLAPEVRPGIWNSLQVPGGGTIRIPLRPGGKPRPFFGKPAYSVRNSVLSCEVRNPISSKLAVHARDSMGIISYAGGTTAHPYTIWRRFHVGPAVDYADVPCDDPHASGYMTQCYVDDGKLGGFGEIEYHAPALDASRKIMRMEDRSETWAFESYLPDDSPWFKSLSR